MLMPPLESSKQRTPWRRVMATRSGLHGNRPVFVHSYKRVERKTSTLGPAQFEDIGENSLNEVDLNEEFDRVPINGN